MKAVDFKGTIEGIVIQMDPECEFEEILGGVGEKLKQAGSFFSGAKIIGTASRTLTGKEKQKLSEMLTQAGVHVDRLDFVERIGHNSSNKKTKEPMQIPAAVVPDSAKVIRSTLRSGTNITHPGHVIVVGDVNPGAEIIADGNIVIMGTLRGVAHAGAKGDEGAFICAFRLNPTQLRIGKVITRPPEGSAAPTLPEIAQVRDGSIIIEPLS